MQTIPFLPDRLNAEPVVFRGFTTPEMGLTEEQKAVLLSASKLPRCYTEGVVLAKKIEALFRVVPPSLYLALGMTEKEKKAERRALMREHQCSELEAAVLVARKMDIARRFNRK
ncbi:protein of unknown function [Xenorhabdus doucetiae]|uniref:Conjugative transfer region protein (TIGR03750 family) n=1 Tax=Xenorhabdus doucetiae TaxID=351671 RepID=A0A068QR92_9GAMM|nr:DUF3487 family protein [Xenorhabdus doucetiae]TYO92741.1 conjugative transfer region protein (TIGR03750 family) [Xenorhabdus doucetiae]CDG17156.1 protein of unknown function [Xenorhabdus doucetiae]